MQATNNQNPAIADPISMIRQLLAKDIAASNHIIQQELASEVPLIERIVQHIIDSGGKRLRPLVLLLTTHAIGTPPQAEHHELAAIIEFIHTATLLHDDVVDHSSLRRGQPTANVQWGNAASVLSGDFLYSRAFQILARRSNIPVMKILASTTNQIAEGEVTQLLNRHNPDIDEATYRQIISRKTAKLYSAAAEIGAIVAKASNAHQAAMAAYGLHLGLAFQMVDDLLDYRGDDSQIGKHLGDDLAEGKTTLPLIYAMHHGSNQQSECIRQAIQAGEISNINDITQALIATQADQYTLQCAEQEIDLAQQALAQLPSSTYRDALSALAQFVVSRNY